MMDSGQVILVVGFSFLTSLALLLRFSKHRSDGRKITQKELPSVPDDLLDEIRALIRQKQKIEALKLVRERLKITLREAKEIVDSIHSDDLSWATTTGKDAASSPDELMDQVKALIGANQKILAIKLLRDKLKIGLREAKEIVDEAARKKKDRST
jgi:ribosomal protein L7/L12